VIIAIKTSPNPIVPGTTSGLEISKHWTIFAKENNEKTKKGMFGGGEEVTDFSTVMSAGIGQLMST
jgi:glutamate synthase (NADPH/NADH) small chain